MPRKGIFKSGNAGNSSKSSKQTPAPQEDSDKAKSLFPPGYKWPSSLLHERCQKNGWSKPTVDARKQGNGFSFVVTLAKTTSKSSNQLETVRLEPHPPYIRPTALEARQWGATYALYRFCNSIQLDRVLPPGPREYWQELAAEYKGVPEHQKWMYSPDPFAARKEVDERQAKAAKKREEVPSEREGRGASNSASHEFANAPEVKMASTLRDLTEDTVKKANINGANSHDAALTVLLEDDIPAVSKQLSQLGFQLAPIRNVTTTLSKETFGSAFLATLTPLEACIEYLILHVPECDLPPRFLPNSNSSNPFVTAGHSGKDSDLKKRWIEDKAIKDAGWPAHIVKEVTLDARAVDNFDYLVAHLGAKLIGLSHEDLANLNSEAELISVDELQLSDDNLEGLGAHKPDETIIIMPLFAAPIELHIFLPTDCSNSFNGYPPIYLSSTTVPPYVRLHLVSRLLEAMKTGGWIEEGEGFLMAALRILEEHWELMESQGRPEIAEVLKHLLAPVEVAITATAPVEAKSRSLKQSRRVRQHHGDERSDAQVKADFDTLRQSKGYLNMQPARERLPAFAAKAKFLSTLEKNRVVVVVGETGCGKTTQLPQFILDSEILSKRGKAASIIVTQPRRISAISIAARVGAERADDGSVGYAIRGESRRTSKTKLTFCTTGVVLRRLGSGDKLQDVTHVVVDEVHERSVDSDFLLLELKELLKTHTSLKVILMSATINHETFVRYYDNAPMLTIPGFTHPVTDLYMEDFIGSVFYKAHNVKTRKLAEDDPYFVELKAKGLDDDTIHKLSSITKANRIDYELIAALVQHIRGTAKKGGILIFLPGVQEIRQCLETIRRVIDSADAVLFPLHANLTSDEQQKVFQPTKKWKIIAATNVAETSITIDDIVYVIDSGRAKEISYDPDNGLTKLVEKWVSRAAIKQRRGRAGRTQPGTCYKLYTQRHEQNLAGFSVPEILRTPLENISLTVKVMREHEDVKSYLSRAIDPPEVTAIEKAWSILEELGAVDLSGQLTPLGRHISQLPVDLRLGKMLVLGTLFRCLDPILSVAACLSSKPVFLNPMDKREEASQARLKFDKDNSDLLTDVNAYNECVRYQSEGKGRSSFTSYCGENFISHVAVREVASMRQDYFSALSELGLVSRSAGPTSEALNTNSANTNLIKAIILGGLWPNVARVHLPSSAIKFDKIQAGTVQRENAAKDYKLYDLKEGRVFLHPGSVLFGTTDWKTGFVAYFQKQMTSKVFLRGATEVPMYALLLFGGLVTVNHVGGGLTVGSSDAVIKLRAWPRIGILANQLRRLLDGQLLRCIEEGTSLDSLFEGENIVLNAMLALLTRDGLSL
ncbi:P-loop containing nucleoside triphosphate hydrolase protein [Coniophora puteana RWD-64-598 SS2]|uniref:RNA helicase n=1 Tax=Coniophora puteana (strain RWD-64-598) TaxID=741705 RepID=A0A5M3N687_CONPW|nr:P-loop containing nucleoside triphosphate hydrolase protein [Coniophora puteana RWD-64-598 SS2]EIW86949.1 P-loop containing nucleoside triphosphate hydrolase protein [Coniophora puteana RWD-64-598 SS2]